VAFFFYLEKAFDCVSHKILLAKPQVYRIADNMFKLIKSYVENRYWRVSLNNNSSWNNISEWGLIIHGVP
jgi:hypothetical protein